VRQIIIHAPNVHIGGGLTLLTELISAWPEGMRFIAVLDARCKHVLKLPLSSSIVWTNASIRSRIASELELSRLANGADRVVVCFNGLPPIFRCRCNVICFVQNVLFVTKVSLKSFPTRVRIRLLLERWWFKWFSSNVTTFLVQTQVMLDELRKTVPNHGSSKIMPFAPLPLVETICSVSDVSSFDFIYIASGEPHKNHKLLLDAWELLALDGIFPSLALTVDETVYPDIAKILLRYRNAFGGNVTNLGAIDNSQVSQLYVTAGALIYPSFYESFGLPLFEAKQHGLDIIASERDYVRDVVNPKETFNPESARSIKSSVKRYLALVDTPVEVVSGSEFLKEIIQ
jgi:glycosyltransferase involved in cell wall biosynthesis